MADRYLQTKAGPGEAKSPPMSATEFEATPEFDIFRRGMKQLLKVSKAQLDARVKAEKEASPRAGNPNAPGRKRDLEK